MSSKQANTTPDCVLLKYSNRALVVRSGPEINSRACLCVRQGQRHNTRYCFSIQRFIFLLIFCLETPKNGSGPTNRCTEPSLESLSVNDKDLGKGWTQKCRLCTQRRRNQVVLKSWERSGQVLGPALAFQSNSAMEYLQIWLVPLPTMWPISGNLGQQFVGIAAFFLGLYCTGFPSAWYGKQ